MVFLISKNLEATEIALLQSLQNQINIESTFAKKAEKAKKLWDNKGDSKRQQAFAKIKQLLKDMCVGIEICNYCECNEANDIEHIYPKSFFPEKTFEWDNYLLACKQCNTAYKLDKCFTLDHSGTLQNTTRGQEPIHKIIAFVNPRSDDPKSYFWLNLRTWQFELFDELLLFQQNKAAKTLEILGLNQRALLVAQREMAAGQFYDKLERLTRLLRASSFSEMEAILSPHDAILDASLPLDALKVELKKTLQIHFQKQKYGHPSVWEAIKMIASKTNPKWRTIFEQIPEALQW